MKIQHTCLHCKHLQYAKVIKNMSSASTSTVICRDQSLYIPYKFSQLHKWNCKYLILTSVLNRICKSASQPQPSITGCRCARAAVSLWPHTELCSAKDGSCFGYPYMFLHQCQWWESSCAFCPEVNELRSNRTRCVIGCYYTQLQRPEACRSFWSSQW